MEAALLTRDLVNVISAFKPEPEKQAKFREASQTAVPRFLSPGSKALTGQAVPHLLYDHADSTAAAEDSVAVMRKKRSSKQAAHPAATPNSSETPSGKPYLNWHDCCLTLLQQQVTPLLDTALRLNKSPEDCITAQIHHDNSKTAASQHKLPSGVQYPPCFEQLVKMDQDRVASTASILKQQQKNFSLNKELFREVLRPPAKHKSKHQTPIPASPEQLAPCWGWCLML